MAEMPDERRRPALLSQPQRGGVCAGKMAKAKPGLDALIADRICKHDEVEVAQLLCRCVLLCGPSVKNEKPLNLCAAILLEQGNNAYGGLAARFFECSKDYPWPDGISEDADVRVNDLLNGEVDDGSRRARELGWIYIDGTLTESGKRTALGNKKQDRKRTRRGETPQWLPEALVLIKDGVSLRETARRLRVSHSTLSRHPSIKTARGI